MCVQRKEEGHKQMMRIPECLERLLPDLLMSRRVHEHHAQEHHMASDAPCLFVMYLDGSLAADLRPFHIEEAFEQVSFYFGTFSPWTRLLDIMSTRVDNGPE